MQKTAEAVSLGHPDKIADYISSYILDRMIEQDSHVKYATEVMIKDNTVALGGEITGHVSVDNLGAYVVAALDEIGYNREYATRWGARTINPDKIKIINMIGVQSPDINRGVVCDGWGDQGVFVGYACRGDGNINRELYLARKLNRALYELARESDALGLDIKTQITVDDNGEIDTAIVAIPMLRDIDLTDFVVRTLSARPRHLIINGTGRYTYHASVADCGITGRKLACDFYSTACPIGGGSPWTKDASKADVTLNIFARRVAIENLGDNDECFVYLSSCIGRGDLPSASVKTIKDGITTTRNISVDARPSVLIPMLKLDTPIFAKMCRNGLV